MLVSIELFSCLQLNRWKKNGTALSKLVAAVLSFGEGLRLGPDSDGLLNFGDTPPEVRATWQPEI